MTESHPGSSRRRHVRSVDADVLIVGGGAVGAALALVLDALNYRVTLAELRPPQMASSNPERVIALNAGSVRLLRRLGVWEELAPKSGRIEHIVVTEPGNRGRVDMDAREMPATATSALGHVVEMGDLLAPLYARLEASNVTIVMPAQLSELSLPAEGRDAVRASFQKNDERVEVRASLLVGADGTNSSVRRMAGIGTRGWDYNRFGIVASVRAAKPHGQVAYECFRPAGPLAFLPLADGRFSIVWAVPPAEATQLLEMPDEAFLAALRRAAGPDLIKAAGDMLETSPRAAYPLELTVAEHFSRPRLALIGNAAHTIHPVAGQGMNLGLRDVEVLQGVLDSELARRDPGQPIVMQPYAEKRRLDVLAVAGFTESMVDGFGLQWPGIRWLRGLGLDLMQSWPGLKRPLLMHAAGLAQRTGVDAA